MVSHARPLLPVSDFRGDADMTIALRNVLL
jgi:hypothetical protein